MSIKHYFQNYIRESSAIIIRMELRSATVEKMAGIFTRRIWQPDLRPNSYHTRVMHVATAQKVRKRTCHN